MTRLTSGWISEEEARLEHAKWVAELEASGELQHPSHHDEEVPTPR